MVPISLLSCVLFIPIVYADRQYAHNDRPIIGIVTQKPPLSVLEFLDDKNYTSFIAASYVKYVESAGARVIPIFNDRDDDYYRYIASSINGILLPGGGVSITNTSGYGVVGQKLYDYVVEAYHQGTYIPIWGTCLGLEILSYLSAGCENWLKTCQAYNEANKLYLQEGFKESLMLKEAPDYLINFMTDIKTTVNFHRDCLTPENFTASGLSENYKMLATSFDANGLEYVALMEHRYLPIFASQFHPEKPIFEWTDLASHNAIPHGPDSIAVSQYLSDFFVSQCRYNTQQFPTKDEEEAALIYNYDTIYTGALGSSFTESYLFR